MRYYLIIIATIILDRVTKFLIETRLSLGETIPVIENFFHITYVQNRGAAFNLWEDQWIIIMLFPAIMIIVGMVLIIKFQNIWGRLMLAGTAMICGGGLGNLIDRGAQGYVIDFFDFRIFPVFNLADIAICAGCGLIVLDVFGFGKRMIEK